VRKIVAAEEQPVKHASVPKEFEAVNAIAIDWQADDADAFERIGQPGRESEGHDCTHGIPNHGRRLVPFNERYEFGDDCFEGIAAGRRRRGAVPREVWRQGLDFGAEFAPDARPGVAARKQTVKQEDAWAAHGLIVDEPLDVRHSPTFTSALHG
jgi:hypothetical protein